MSVDRVNSVNMMNIGKNGSKSINRTNDRSKDKSNDRSKEGREYVTPVIINTIDNIIEELGFFGYFSRSKIDMDLLYLAFVTPNRKHDKNNKIILEYIDTIKLKEKYFISVLGNDVLEFYGDKIYSMVITDIVKQRYHLNITSADATTTVQSLISNNHFTQISSNIGICPRVYGIHNISVLPKHNVCSDNFEAILGAIYFSYGLECIPMILKWIKSTPFIMDSIRNSMVNVFYLKQHKLFNNEILYVKPGTLIPYNYPSIYRYYLNLYPHLQVIEIDNIKDGWINTDIYLENKRNKNRLYLTSYYKELSDDKKNNDDDGHSITLFSDDEISGDVYEGFIRNKLWVESHKDIK